MTNAILGMNLRIGVLRLMSQSEALGVAVGVQVGGSVGIGKTWESWLLFSLLSVTCKEASTKAVFSPKYTYSGNHRVSVCPVCSPDVKVC